MRGASSRLILIVVAIVALAGAGFAAWRYLPSEATPGIATGNGRIEATEIDIAAKIAGRIRDIAAAEGDFVTAGQILATMDTAQLDAQRREAQAQKQRATIAVETARILVTQREAERTAATAVVAQRQAERDAADRRLARTEQLVRGDHASLQTQDDDRARAQGARAALAAAQAQLAASEATIAAAKSQIVDAQAAVAAVEATLERIAADIDDSVLKAPRDGRIQYRVAQPGEVVAAGGRILNLVDLTDVYMNFFLPTEQVGRVALGAEARIVLDVLPNMAIPARISYVADVSQFTPKSVETAQERLKLVFRVKARIDPALLRKHIEQVKTGLPGVAYVQLDPGAAWPARFRNVVDAQ